jgi:Thiamine-binding protein
MLVAFSVSPMGVGEDVAEYVADAVRVVRESGLPNRTDAMFTTVEGDWVGSDSALMRRPRAWTLRGRLVRLRLLVRSYQAYRRGPQVRSWSPARQHAHGQRPARAMAAPRTPWPSFYRSGDTGRSTGALTAHPARSVREGCASVARRGTDLLAGRSTARTATAGTRPPSGERADGGLRTGRGPGPGRQRRRTRQPAPSSVTAAWAAPSLTTFRLTPCPLRG